MDKVLSARDCIIHKGVIYFYASEIGWIVKMDKEIEKIQYMPIREFKQPISADCCASAMDFLYFISVDGMRLLEYEMKEGTYHTYNIDCGRKRDGNNIALFPMEREIYIFPRYVKQVVIFHCDSKDISVWQYPQLWSDITFQSACQQDGKVWLFSNDGDVVCLDLKTYQWDFFKMDISISGIVHTVLKQELIYLLLCGGEICVWDTVKKKAHFCKIKKEEQRNESYIRMAFTDQNRCVLLPSIGKYIELYDLETGQLISAEDITKCRKRIEGREHWSAFRGYNEDADWYYFLSHAYRDNLKISKKTGKLYWYTPQYPSEADWMGCRVDSGEYLFYEGTQPSSQLSTYIKSLQSRDAHTMHTVKKEIGKKIWAFNKEEAGRR